MPCQTGLFRRPDDRQSLRQFNSLPLQLLPRVAFGPGITPVPLNAMDCGLPTVSSVIISDALCGPMLVGVKTTLIEQLADAARVEPQVWV